MVGLPWISHKFSTNFNFQVASSSNVCRSTDSHCSSLVWLYLPWILATRAIPAPKQATWKIWKESGSVANWYWNPFIPRHNEVPHFSSEEIKQGGERIYNGSCKNSQETEGSNPFPPYPSRQLPTFPTLWSIGEEHICLGAGVSRLPNQQKWSFAWRLSNGTSQELMVGLQNEFHPVQCPESGGKHWFQNYITSSSRWEKAENTLRGYIHVSLKWIKVKFLKNLSTWWFCLSWNCP